VKRIAIDMDEVLADTLTELLARYNRDFDDHITKADLVGKSLWDVVTLERHDRLSEYLHSTDFFADLAIMPDAQQVLARMAKMYEIYIATSAMEFPNSFAAKYQWLRQHFPFLPPTHFVFCGDKGILHADYLIDDLPHNFRRFTGVGILFSAPHNANERGYERVGSWREVAARFLD
jgi:5'(3')-deoxyribonucleotidase